MPLKRRAAPRAEIMGWDGSAWQRLPVESSANPNLRIALYDGTDKANITLINTDGLGTARKALDTAGFKYGFNESTWDRWRSNTEATVLPSATRTASGSSASQTNYNARGVIIWISITAVSGTFAAGEGLKLWIEGKNPVTGTFFAIIPAIGPYTSPTNIQMLVYPGATDAAGAIEGENDIPLPRGWRVYYTITGTNPSFTFSVGASYVV